MDAFTAAYIECSLWASVTFDVTPLDEVDAEWDSDSYRRMIEDAAEFQEQEAELLAQAYDVDGYTAARAGHDFWLTRNHHGAGFWDRGLGDVGAYLTEEAQIRQSVDLYIGDDGHIYLSP